jgi:hypothetical protein
MQYSYLDICLTALRAESRNDSLVSLLGFSSLIIDVLDTTGLVKYLLLLLNRHN